MHVYNVPQYPLFVKEIQVHFFEKYFILKLYSYVLKFTTFFLMKQDGILESAMT